MNVFTKLGKKIARTAVKGSIKVQKHAPLILTVTGVVGLGVTAVLAYKCKDKVEAIVEDIETKTDAKQELDYSHIGLQFIKATALPITVGALSMGAIIWSYKIQQHRLAVLSGIAAASQETLRRFHKKYKEVHGEEQYNKFMTERQEIVGKDENGNDILQTTRVEHNSLFGEWYDKSSFYHPGNSHESNLLRIEQIEKELDALQFTNQRLTLNQVRERLGYPRIKSADGLGYSAYDAFRLEAIINDIPNERTGIVETQIFVQWPAPHYIYEDSEFTNIIE